MLVESIWHAVSLCTVVWAKSDCKREGIWAVSNGVWYSFCRRVHCMHELVLREVMASTPIRWGTYEEIVGQGVMSVLGCGRRMR